MSLNNSENAWNPGLKSDIPANLWPLVTLFRDDNAYVSYPVAKELADLTGFNVLELMALRPERLVVHALLVRVTADLSVPDGPNYEELGINLRGMVQRIHSGYIQAELPGIVATFEEERSRARSYVSEQLSSKLFDRPEVSEPVPRSGSLFTRWFQKPPPGDSQSGFDEPVEITAIKEWKAMAVDQSNALQLACLNALIKTVDTIVGHRGRVIPDASLICDIVVNQVANTHGAEVLEAFIEPIWQQAIAGEGYRLLPVQDKPVIMNVKGASASGKSTIRPQQRQLAGKLGIPWEDFALISPDYWRKYLLDYTSLGDDYKYGAMLTGRELEIIDKKLDRYMAAKASSGSLPHMLIDRFRFDSFTVNTETAEDSKLLSRFGDRVYLFFMVTHPVNTVARAWERGLKTGRYKAVDDLLYHNVEAFTGMPSLFLSWVNSRNKQIHFEFLDNDVALGELPRTAAFGWNGSLTILDISLPIKIDRYRKVNIAARQPEDVLNSRDPDLPDDQQFIVQCAARVPHIVFADQATAAIYAIAKDGKLHWWDQNYIQQHSETEGLLKTLSALGYSGEDCPAMPAETPPAIKVDREKQRTVGYWHGG